MSASYTRYVLGASIIKGTIIFFNIVAVASFFFIQVGSIFLIVPAAIIDVMYLLNQEQVGPHRDAVKPSFTIMKLVLTIIFACLVIFSAVFIYEIVRSI